ncbi:MAG TPA: hypothetical protein VN712_04860 [Dermatophilaceae bacterium]|nr:hypothetical protein [Dermatophilaceae bacterium]
MLLGTAQNPAPPLPLEPPPPEGLDVVGVVLLGCPPLVLPPLEPQAAVAMPNPSTITIGAIRRAIVRRVVDLRVIVLSSITLLACECRQGYGHNAAWDCADRLVTAVAV